MEVMTRPISRRASPRSKRSARCSALWTSSSCSRAAVSVVGEILVRLLQVGFVTVSDLIGGGLIADGQRGEHVGDELGIVLADFVGLVEVPFVGGARLKEHGFCVRTVTEDSDDGDDDRQYADGETDGVQAGFPRSVFVLLLEFVGFAGVHRVTGYRVQGAGYRGSAGCR